MIKLLRWSVLIGCLAFANASAAAVLQVDIGTGKLTGASGVDVGGTLYNVEFLDGTCKAVFAGCDALADFAFQTGGAAAVASFALLDQVFLDGPAGNFDSIPTLTRGCNPFPDQHIEPCFAMTPFALSGTFPLDDVESLKARNTDAVAILQDGVIGSPEVLPTSHDTVFSPDLTWARWTLAEQSVPEPGTIAILGAGLLALVMTRRRRTQTRDRIL